MYCAINKDGEILTGSFNENIAIVNEVIRREKVGGEFRCAPVKIVHDNVSVEPLREAISLRSQIGRGINIQRHL